jgi:hypothetical protein
MRIAFWNINQNTNSYLLDLLSEFSNSRKIDLLILLESRFNPEDVLLSINRHEALFYYSPSIAFREDDYFQIYSKFDPKSTLSIKEEKRKQARIIQTSQVTPFTLIMMHLQSKLYFDEANQNAMTPQARFFIDQAEALAGNDRTIVLGDFNMQPFQYGMVQTTGLHATMDKRTARMVTRQVNGEDFKLFYNPMWSFFGEFGKGDVNGTYYYNASKPIEYYWYLFDQVLVRPSMLEEFDEKSLEIVTKIGKHKLLTPSSTIDETISDHLPVTFNLKTK